MAVLLERWRGLARRERTLFTATALGAVLLAIALLAAQRDTRVALFAEPLHPEQVSEVVERLAEWNEPFVASADNVRVEAARRNALLLKLSIAGVPHRHLSSSSEALAKASPLAPQAVIEAQQREGLADDLAAGLRGLPGVADAQVIVAPARSANFADDPAQAAGAAVRVSLTPGARLRPEVIAGIRTFVAAGVPGLSADRVAVLDDRGLALDPSEPSGDGEAPALQDSLQSALDAALGTAATIVRVRVTYDPRSREVREVVRKPLGSRAIGTTTLDERYTGERKHYSRLHASEDRGSDVHDERTDIPAGRVERLSVAVFVDAARHLDLAQIRELAAATVGLRPQMGDELRVDAVPFSHPPERAPSMFAMLLGFLGALLPAVWLLLGGLLLRHLVGPAERITTALLSKLTVVRASRAVAGYAPAQVRGALRDEPPHTVAAIISALPAATATAVLEMYPAHERAAIVQRMARANAPVVPDYEAVIRRG